MPPEPLPGPGKRRSKQGCLTCRQRRKKCDETHSDAHNGACQRCIQGAWSCQWPAPGATQPVRPYERGGRAGSKQPTAAEGALRPEATTAPSTHLVPTTAASAVFGVPTASSSAPPAVTFPFLAAPPASPMPAATVYSGIQPLSSSFDASLYPTGTSSLSSLYPFNVNFANGNNNSNPLPPPTGLSAGMEGIDDFFQTVDVELAGWDNALDPAVPYPLPGFESPAAGPSTAGHVVDGGGIDLEDTEGYMDPTYNVLNDSYLCALAKPLRDLIVQSASRAVVSSELNRNAAMAVCMIYRMRAQQQVHAEAAVRPDNDAEEECLRKKSDGYFHRAIDNLQSQPIPLGAKMLAFLDLHEHQFFQVGAAASTVLRRLGDTFVEELGPRPVLDVVKLDSYDRVLLSMYAWSDCVRTITVPKKRTLFAFTRLPGEPSVDSPGTLVDSVTDFVSPLPSLVGLPVGLMLCFAATSNLSAEMDALPDEVVKAKATAIEKAIRAWHLPTPTAHELADSAYYMETLTNSEMWRHAAIIYLYQAVYLHGPLSKVILASLQQILQLGARSLVQYEQSTSRLAPGSDSPAALATPPTTTTPSATSPAAPPPTSETMDRFFSPVHRAVPFFLAGTCALLPSEREVCLRGLRACGPAKGWSDDVAALERVWEVQGEKGWLRDWRTVLEEEKLHIAFL